MNVFKKLRTDKGITQVELAQIMNVQQTTVSKWEVGKATPDYPVLLKLSEYYGVSLEYLLGREEKNAPPAQQESLNIPDALKPYQFAFYEGMDGLSEESIKDILKYVEFTREKEQKETKKK